MPKNKNYAIINIGSLKTKSLFGYFDEDNRIVPLYQSNNLTCFGCGMFESGGKISQRNVLTTINEVLRLKELVKKYNCRTTRLFATHALREAVNQKEVTKQIQEKTGFDIEIIAPKEEGELYFQAVTADFPSKQELIVVDMGGGSCQILIGDREKLRESYSFKTGAQYLHERFTKDPHNPESITTSEDIEKIKAYLVKEYSILPADLNFPLIYGSSNIIDLLKALKIPLEPRDSFVNHPYKTYAAHLNNFVAHIINFPFEVREKMYTFQKGYIWGVDKAFVNIITLNEKFNSPFILPTNASIMEGFFYKLRREE